MSLVSPGPPVRFPTLYNSLIGPTPPQSHRHLRSPVRHLRSPAFSFYNASPRQTFSPDTKASMQGFAQGPPTLRTIRPKPPFCRLHICSSLLSFFSGMGLCFFPPRRPLALISSNSIEEVFPALVGGGSCYGVFLPKLPILPIPPP